MSEKDKKPTIADWLGFEWPLRTENAPRLGRFLGFVLQALALFLIVLALGSLILLLISGAKLFTAPSTADAFADFRNLALVLAALIGAPFIVWRAFVVQKQADIAEQGLITDRINKAVEQLGSEKSVSRAHDRKKQKAEKWDGTTPRYYTTTRTKPNLEVRLGAISRIYAHNVSMMVMWSRSLSWEMRSRA